MLNEPSPTPSHKHERTAIYRSAALLLGMLPEWLTADDGAEAAAALHAALRLLLASLAHPESERAAFSLKSKQVSQSVSQSA